jgi:hypothetical protein
VVGCVHRAGDPYRRPAGVPAWTVDPPRGCATGLSGPTLHPADQIVYAGCDARERYAYATLAVRVSGTEVDTGGDVASVTTQEAEGVVAGVRIVAAWYDRRGAGPHGGRDVLYALACAGDADIAPPKAPKVPPWVLGVPREAGRLCALGLAGPTFDPDDQIGNARADARERLAEALASRVRVMSLDVDGEEFDLAGESAADDRAREAAGRAEATDTWLDEKGTGPLARRGVAYALACVAVP